MAGEECLILVCRCFYVLLDIASCNVDSGSMCLIFSLNVLLHFLLLRNKKSRMLKVRRNLWSTVMTKFQRLCSVLLTVYVSRVCKLLIAVTAWLLSLPCCYRCSIRIHGQTQHEESYDMYWRKRSCLINCAKHIPWGEEIHLIGDAGVTR